MCSILFVGNMRPRPGSPKLGNKYKLAKPTWGRILSYLGAAAILAGVTEYSIYENQKPIELTYPAHGLPGYMPVYVPANSITLSNKTPPGVMGGTS
jgi:hypothetical protein